MDDNVPSDNCSVFLLTRFDRFYMDRVVRYHGGEPVILEVTVPRASLSADEEWIAPAEWPTIQNATDALYRTMCGGSCKHRGRIPPEQIRSIRKIDGTILLGTDTE